MIKINDKAQARKNTLSRCGHEEGSKNWQFMAIKGDTTSILDPVTSSCVLIENLFQGRDGSPCLRLKNNGKYS